MADLDGSGSSSGGVESAEEGAWTPQERALLDAALEFYGASATVIDYAGPDGPQVRQDAAGFEAIRQAMRRLEERVRAAHAAGMTSKRIAEVARLDPEMVELMVRRGGAAPSAPSDGER